MEELYDALDHELENLTLLEARAFLYQLKLDVPAPITDEEVYEWIDFLTYIRGKIKKIDDLFIVFEN